MGEPIVFKDLHLALPVLLGRSCTKARSGKTRSFPDNQDRQRRKLVDEAVGLYGFQYLAEPARRNANHLADHLVGEDLAIPGCEGKHRPDLSSSLFGSHDDSLHSSHNLANSLLADSRFRRNLSVGRGDALGVFKISQPDQHRQSREGI